MEKREPSHTDSGNVNWGNHYEIQYGGSSKKTKNRVAIGSNNPPPGHISRQHFNSKRYMHPSVHKSTIYHSQDIETPRYSLTGEWIKKRWYIYTMEYYSAIK